MNAAYRKLVKTGRTNGPLMLMALPGVIYLLLFKYLPMGGIVIAFKDYNFSEGILGSDWVGLKNFEFLFSSQDAWRITLNTLYLNFLFIVTGTIISLILALSLNELRSKWFHSTVQSAFFLPYLLSWVLVGYFVYALLTTNGLVNKTLEAFGMDTVNWYAAPEYWPFILVMLSVWKGAGYTSIIYLASILGINPEYYEAAKMDGASRMQQVRYITIPLIRPVIIMMTLIALGNIFHSDFGMFYNVTRNAGSLYATTDVIDTYVFRMFRTLGDVGISSAAGFYQAIVGFMLVLFTNMIVKRIDRENAMF
ncbi:sugar ABC transporter permease [Paenibacillus sp. 32352]|uniref:ABC transporter permease n=1 Tax=Paenibacillus sp. 32352 TaxID=1969111 RepID=UPI0021175BFB|nr:ABC transporter permease subunit [Paenibacillus sp. 32352]